MELQKTSNIHPASFSIKNENLSKGQRKILNLLKKSISDCKQITTDDIVDCYFDTVSKNGKTIMIRTNFSTPYFSAQDVDRNHYVARSRAISWFKNNLGSCIIKGRLLAIPIIEIS